MNDLEVLVKRFREAIEKAMKVGSFKTDSSFYRFPRGCCGSASDLLGEYLKSYGIQTWYVNGTHYPKCDDPEETWTKMQSHAWLTTKDPRVFDDYVVIDITGDQFCNDEEYGCFNQKVYVGPMNDFHRLFEVEDRDVHPSLTIQSLGNIATPILCDLYQKILEQMTQK